MHKQSVLIGSMKQQFAAFALLSLATMAQASDRQSREMVEALEAYGVVKLGMFEEGFDRFMALAEKGNMQGILNVAHMLQAGQGTAKDEAAAFEWYRKAADEGSAIGMFYTGRAYEAGKGVPRDVAEAEAWYRQASTRDDGDSSEAQLALGKLLLREGNVDEGRRWVQQSAENGDIEAQRFLARLNSEVAHNAGVNLVDRALIEEAWGAIDSATASGNAAGVVYYLKRDAEVRVRLPGNADWVAMDKAQLRDFWQQTFDRATHYRLVRRDLRLTQAESTITVDSVIDETIVTASGSETLQLSESAQVRIVDDKAVIDRIAIAITRQ